MFGQCKGADCSRPLSTCKDPGLPLEIIRWKEGDRAYVSVVTCRQGVTFLGACVVAQRLALTPAKQSETIKTIRNEFDSQMPVLNLPTDDPYTESLFRSFQPVSIQCFKNTILKSSQQTCSLDPIPTSLFVEYLDQLLPAVTAIINKSLQTGVFPSVFKEAIVIPFLKNKQNHLTRTI